MSTAPLLEVCDLQVAFRSGRHALAPAVKGVSFTVPRNRTVALVGESGSGKSVTALAAMGLLAADAAVIAPASRIVFDGVDVLALDAGRRRALCGKDIAMIFQEPMSSLNPVLTVGYQIAEVLVRHLRLRGRAVRERVLALLEEVGIPEPARRIDAYPHELSGGQQQRVMIAMAIACAPRLLIADEPTTALDVTVQKQIMELIKRLQHAHGMAVLFITHDLALVADIADDVIVMRDGVVREAGPARDVLTQPRDPYTRALLQCRPPIDARPLRLPVIADVMEGRAPVTVQRPARTPTGGIVLRADQLSKSFTVRDGWFRKREFPAVSNVSFALERGTTLGVVGESGCGKSTLGLTLMQLHRATGGTVLFDGRDVRQVPLQEFRRRMQIVFQNPYASLNPRFTVEQILLEPMQLHGIGANDAERTRMAQALLEKVGLPRAALQRWPHEFSGGQRQRIAIARCLALQPDVLVCDESVSALDVSVQAQVLNLLLDLQQEYGLSYIFISHDLSVVRYMADHVMVMRRGEVVEQGEAETLYRRPEHPYTQALLAAVPGAAPAG
ncbi:ABC transporter ATP-binding protein [Pseudoduganella ginsengisoli]|uniref:Dipeptide ABC transporter ATP-binding protein n=1 Tax=Pseudoduganella ginsengisoli TaxID=1462440 RepID=A0A6L6Q5H8_9BURK|nr:ABC transporter ATP-binding protein [Pseudoduganella ginsengisoli]MTW04940.1 dipeptide ABC transporter ATP-binding protein [Pseudoduganella ginsengisoli]